MKLRIIVAATVVIACLALTSCASSKGGCKSTQNFVGYGK
jgi:predicted small secreted protein